MKCMQAHFLGNCIIIKVCIFFIELHKKNIRSYFQKKRFKFQFKCIAQHNMFMDYIQKKPFFFFFISKRSNTFFLENFPFEIILLLFVIKTIFIFSVQCVNLLMCVFVCVSICVLSH